MFVDVQINRDLIGRVEIANVTTDPGQSTHTYDWSFVGEGERRLNGTLTHRYADGAMVLAHRVLGEIAHRYRAAALYDDGIVDAEIYCNAYHPVVANHGCGLNEGHEGSHQTSVLRWPNA